MATREEVFDKFGPLALEAMLEVFLSELNEVRSLAGLPSVSKQKLYDSMEDKHRVLEKYDWMKEIDDKVKLGLSIIPLAK